MTTTRVPVSTCVQARPGPGNNARRTLAEDYRRMVEDGLLLDDAEPFDALPQRCQAPADEINAAER